ncbi:MAG: hydantoinase B/oxoprolinase family protein [Hyphomicrobiales bacterium]|nr:hydantoinase B/oxoprolinase family protein [Hyphomicrobiales bacterium]
MNKKNWNFWVDKGGTFTDIIALSPKKDIYLEKILSNSKNHYDDPISYGIQSIINRSYEENDQIDNITIGTTVATNSILERTGQKTLLIVSKGFKDSQLIKYQNREQIFELNIKKTRPLYSDVIEIDERISSEGIDIIAPDWEKIENKIEKITKRNFSSICVSLIHGWKFPKNELKMYKILSKLGYKNITLGHEISQTIKYIRRTNSSIINAYVDPVIREDVRKLKEKLMINKNKIDLKYMQSNGGLSDEKNFKGINSILSGPAGGVMGAIAVAKASNSLKIITFDMGGTSTDVSHYSGQIEYQNEKNIDHHLLQVPMIDIETVASGGGSILEYNNSRMTVGSKSAGSNPGPMCYGKGGPLTITDANLYLGRISQTYFPKIFGEDGKSPLNKDLVIKNFQILRNKIDKNIPIEEIVDGYIRISIEKMCRAIKQISTKRGFKLAGYSLVSYGGAGGQHACLIADNLNMERIIINPFSSFLSAYGLANSLQKHTNQKTLLLEITNNNINKIIKTIEKLKLKNSINFKIQKLNHNIIIYLKYLGTEQSLSIRVREDELYADNIIRKFDKIHKKLFGYVSNKKIIIEMVQLETTSSSRKNPIKNTPVIPNKKIGVTDIYTMGSWKKANIYDIDTFDQRRDLSGPAILLNQYSTVIIEDGWKAKRDQGNNIILSKKKYLKNKNIPTNSNVMLEIFNNLFMSVAETMGETLKRTAASVNIKERLDYSCAVFDKSGNLVANAPHIPVHLGSMDDCIKKLIHAQKKMNYGDVFINNSPNFGGTHLPDITLISPIFSSNKKEIIFYLATRGHHPDVGGIYPGSMSPKAKILEEEGVIFENMKILSKNKFDIETLRQKLLDAKYPARSPELNLQDIIAQIAANKIGEIELNKIIHQYGFSIVYSQMKRIRKNAKECVLEVIKTIEPSKFSVAIDNILFNLSIDFNKKKNKICFNFIGSSPEQPNNFNAPIPITKAVILYVLRCLIDADIPLNSGILEPVDILTDKNSLLNPSNNAAVSAGNVEISQVIANCIFATIGIKASCQSTMNNLIFGNKDFQYYETICGGQGAGNYFNGCDAIQTNMTNSKLTDPEVFEEIYPILLIELSINYETGGKGKFIGGSGIRKVFKLNTSMDCSILSNNRSVPPFGLNGGQSGSIGKNFLIRNEIEIELDGNCQIQLQKDDILIIETPSGGGYGKLS